MAPRCHSSHLLAAHPRRSKTPSRVRLQPAESSQTKSATAPFRKHLVLECGEEEPYWQFLAWPTLIQCRPLLEKAQPARKDIVLSRRLRFEPFQLPSPAWFLLRSPHRWSEMYSEHVTQKDLVDCSWRSYAPT